jgi:CheY-like chemotaxis protein
MFSPHLRFLFAFLFLGVVLTVGTPLHGQDKPDADAIKRKKTLELIEKAQEEYRVFFKQPETTIEYWAAIQFEMDLGKFDLAAYHLNGMLGKNPKVKVDPDDKVDADLVKLEQAEGMSAFLRLERVRQWSEHPPFQKEATENVDALIKRVTKAVDTHLSDPVRINNFIKQLVAPTPEERAFAFDQIARSRQRAVPYLVEALRVNNDKPLYRPVRETMLRMGPETVPVYLEVFKAQTKQDYGDTDLRMTLLDIIQQRGDKRVVPYLWHMSSAKAYPPPVRKKAKEVLASFLKVDVADLPPAKQVLTQMAERYYQKKAPVADDKAKKIKVWEWTGQAIVQRDRTPYEVEENLGPRYAREALDLDPSYQPAQVVMLNLMLERTYGNKVEQILMQPMPPKMQQLLTTLDADLIMRVLERGMEDRQIPVVLPVIQALGERGEFRAARPSSGQPRGLVRALYYPDRRVQFAAMKAMLRMPPSGTPAVASDRIVELSRRFLASDPNPKALIVYAPIGQEPAARQIAKDLGYEADVARKTHEAVEKGKASADYDLVILHHGMPGAEFPFVYTQLRKDFDLGGLPMIVVVEKSREKAVKKFVAKDAGVLVIPEEQFKAGDDFKKIVEEHFKKADIVKLTPAERKDFSRVSMDTLWRMAHGEIQGYNVLPALDVVKRQLRSPENALQALEILGRLPGKEIQYQLAAIATDPAQDAKVRLPAAIELNRHMQKNGVQLDKKQLADLKEAHKESAEGTPFRAQLNVTISMIARPTAPRTGADLLRFSPDAPAPAKEEKKDKDN